MYFKQNKPKDKHFLSQLLLTFYNPTHALSLHFLLNGGIGDATKAATVPKVADDAGQVRVCLYIAAKIFQAESGMGKGPFTVGLPHRQGMGLSDGVSEKV